MQKLHILVGAFAIFINLSSLGMHRPVVPTRGGRQVWAESRNCSLCNQWYYIYLIRGGLPHELIDLARSEIHICPQFKAVKVRPGVLVIPAEK